MKTMKKLWNKLLNLEHTLALCLAITLFTVTLKIIFPYSFEQPFINFCYIAGNIVAGILCAIALEKTKQPDKYINKAVWILFSVTFVLSIPWLMKYPPGVIFSLVFGTLITYHSTKKFIVSCKGKIGK